jgi:hypothetical protein
MCCVQNMQLQKETEVKIMKAKLSLQQLSELGEETRCYKGMGKAYICTKRSNLIQLMEGALKEHLADLEKQRSNKSLLEKNIESAEKEMKELLQSNQELGRQFLTGAAS